MFSKFNQKINTIFLDSSSENFSINDRVNIVLSPSLYWVKKVSLPVKYLRDLKPLLPSLFEDILPQGNYSYSAYTSGTDYFIFAYEDKIIIDLLREKNVLLHQINNVFFAQSVLADIEHAIKIDEYKTLYIKEDILITLPSELVEANEYLDISNEKLPKHYVTLNQFGHIVNNKSLYLLIATFSLFIFITCIEYVIVYNQNTAVSEQKDELFSNNGLKSTMIQNSAMLKEYKSLHQRQSKIREYVGYVTKIKLEKNQTLSLLSVKENKIALEFTGVAKNSEKKIVKQFDKYGMKYKSSFKSKNWQVEISL